MQFNRFLGKTAALLCATLAYQRSVGLKHDRCVEVSIVHVGGTRGVPSSTDNTMKRPL
jgi:hypothetical protein